MSESYQEVDLNGKGFQAEPQMDDSLIHASGLSYNIGECESAFTTSFSSVDINKERSSPLPSDNSNLIRSQFHDDPYGDDDLLQDEFVGSFPRQVAKPLAAEHIRHTYNQSGYNNYRRGNQDTTPFLEGNGFSNYSNRSSLDFSIGYSEINNSSRVGNSPHGLFPQTDGGDDGLFIESMPAVASDNFVNRVFKSTSIHDHIDAMGDNMLSPRPRSPRLFDNVPQRGVSLFHDEEHATPELRRGLAGQSCGSLSVFRDGGIGVGNHSFSRSNMSNIKEEDGWTRSHSLSRNMDDLGYGYNQYSRSSFASLRSSSLTHPPQGGLCDGMNMGDYGDDLTSYRNDVNYSGRLTPLRVASQERLDGDFAQRGFIPRGDIPHNRSFMDAINMQEFENTSMSHAKSMLYLGAEGDLDGDSFGYGRAQHTDTFRKSRQNSIQDFSALSQSRSQQSTEATAAEHTSESRSSQHSEKPRESEGSPIPEWRVRPSASPVPSHTPTSHNDGARGREERSKSPRVPREDDDKGKGHAKMRFGCRDFEKGVCSRGAACKFYHDPAKAVTTPDKIPVCRDFSKGKCSRDNCRFRHPGTHKDNVLMGIEEPNSPNEFDDILKQYSSTLKPRV